MLKQIKGLNLRTPLLIMLLAGGIGAAAVGCKATGNDAVKEDTTEAEANQNMKEEEASDEAAESTGQRLKSPEVSEKTMEALVAGNTQFALDLYAKVSTESDNVFYSPFSVSEALTMVSAGARGETAKQMMETLNLDLEPSELHPAFNALDTKLMNLGEKPQKPTSEPFQLTIANSIWGQTGENFKPEFVNTLGANYGAGLSTLDFVNGAEPARKEINAWVEEKTQERIKDLMPEGSVTADTRLVLTNAIYFKASWMADFQKEATQQGDFTLRDGSKVKADLMNQVAFFDYAEMDGFKAVALPYDGGDASMLVLLPEDLAKFEASLSADTLNDTVAALEKKNVALTLPKFEFTAPLTLTHTLKAMGMADAFSDSADFSGIADAGLSISEVIHKAFVAVDESGTEAAAATGISMRVTSMPAEPVKFKADKPFIFVIRDNTTGSVLFMGRLANPSAQAE